MKHTQAWRSLYPMISRHVTGNENLSHPIYQNSTTLMFLYAFLNMPQWNTFKRATPQHIFYNSSLTKSRISTVWRMTSLPVLMPHSRGIRTSITPGLRCVFICETKSHYLTWIRFLSQLLHNLCRRKTVLSCVISVSWRWGKVSRIFVHGTWWEGVGNVNVCVSKFLMQSGSFCRPPACESHHLWMVPVKPKSKQTNLHAKWTAFKSH